MEKNIIATEQEFEDFNNTLGEFSQSIRKSIKDLKEADGSEICSLRDDAQGLVCELHSKRISADKLLDLCANGFNYLKNQRPIKSNPLGIS